MNIKDLNIDEAARTFCEQHGVGPKLEPTIRAAMERGAELALHAATVLVKESAAELAWERNRNFVS